MIIPIFFGPCFESLLDFFACDVIPNLRSVTANALILSMPDI